MNDQNSQQILNTYKDFLKPDGKQNNMNENNNNNNHFIQNNANQLKNDWIKNKTMDDLTGNLTFDHDNTIDYSIDCLIDDNWHR